MEYFAHVIVIAGIYAILALSLDLLVGHSAMLSVSHAAFYGVGAYCSALLTLKLGAPFFVGLLAGTAVASMLAVFVALPSLRLVGDYFAIATFGFQMIVFSVFNNWSEVTRGPLGIVGIPRPSLLGWSVTSTAGFAILVWGFAGLAYVAVRQLATSPFGRVLRAIREDEDFPRSLGKRTHAFKLKVFIATAAIASSAGSLYAHYATYIDPSSFTLMESILVIAMVILGGTGSLTGPVLGAIALVTIPEALRFVGMPSSVAANVRQILYGFLLVIMMLFRPRGIIGVYALGR